MLTLENATISWRELNRKLMIGDPSAYGAFAAELTGLPLLAHDVPAVRRARASSPPDRGGYFPGASVPSGATSTPWFASASRTRNWNVDQAPRRASNMR